MQDIDNVIEIKRGLHRICQNSLMDIIAESENCEIFYQNTFKAYGLIYNTATIKQKRCFVAAIAKFFIIDRMPDELISVVDNKYECNLMYRIEDNRRVDICSEIVTNILQEYLDIWDNSSSFEDFKNKYFEKYNVKVKDFKKEISINRNDELSDFAKTVEQVLFSQDNEM